MPTPAAIGHIDADAFYASAERVRNRFLIGKPVGVLGNQGACVIAKSYEMKATGVTTGMPIWDARKLCPDGVYLKRDFRWYEVLSGRLLDAVREFSPAVEYYSIDECFFEAVPLRGASLQETAEALRDHLLKAVGVPVTVGIAPAKTLAKLVSDSAKPFGALALLDRDAVWALLDRLPVTEITGIASRRAARLAPHGITTCLDLALADRLLVRKELTLAGEALWWELRGEPVQPLHTRRPPHKTLSRGGSIGQATADPHRVYAWTVRSLERLVEELEYHRVRPGRLSVWVAYKDGRARAGDGALTAPTDRFDLLLLAAKQGLRQSWIPRVPVTRLHLVATDLRYPGEVQLGLFEPPPERAAALARLKREVNARVGRFALRSAATLYLNDLYRDEAAGYDICDVRGKMCF
jgi:nucleotidyltransferase/DNA polymerase involved in DNA repair